MERRAFLKSSAVVGAGVLLDPWQGLLAQDVRGAVQSGIAKTTSGPIRGVVFDRINAFYGIPYGATTAGDARFLAPRKPQPWANVRDCVEYGPRSPQGPSGLISEVAAVDRREPAGEDCLRLNVWTPALGNGRRPVMVWLHGGGYSQASGSFIIYNGANLARRRDVVVVTLNHRLNLFGYLYLGEIAGEKYADSGNAGMLDIVAALEWVRDNIAAFGGDPGNVTVFGQSGGGGKVCTLMGMPAAKGLFHKAIAQSGSNVTGTSRASATRTAQTFLDRLNLKPGPWPGWAAELHKVPTDRLLGAIRGLNFSPVVDGKNLPAGPFDPVASPLSASVPLLCGSNETEVAWTRGAVIDDIDEAALRTQIKQDVRGIQDADADRLIAAYRKARPGISNVDIHLILASDNSVRNGMLTIAERKADAKQAPVYMYYFTWRSPVHDGKLKAYHTLDIPFVFENVDLATAMTGGRQDRYALQDRMSAAWTSFARTGNPNVKGLLPDWPAFDTTRRATMVLDNECRVVSDPNAEERRTLTALRKAGGADPVD
jgi:para-nitrobenzyl esterase